VLAIKVQPMYNGSVCGVHLSGKARMLDHSHISLPPMLRRAIEVNNIPII
jgi:hypothetical protein